MYHLNVQVTCLEQRIEPLSILTSDSHNSSRILREIFFKQSSSRLKQYLRAGWSMRRKGERETVRKLSSMSRKSLFHVLKLHSLPPLFYNYIFLCASFWKRTASNRSKYEKSIL